MPKSKSSSSSSSSSSSDGSKHKKKKTEEKDAPNVADNSNNFPNPQNDENEENNEDPNVNYPPTNDPKIIPGGNVIKNINDISSNSQVNDDPKNNNIDDNNENNNNNNNNNNENNNENNNNNNKNENNPNYILDKVQGKSRGKIEEVYRYITGISIFLAALSFTLVILGALLKIQMVGSISTFLIGFGFASLCIFLFGIWAVYQYDVIVIEKGEEYSDQSTERELFNLFIYGAIFVLIFMLITGLVCVIYKGEVHEYIIAVGQNQKEWKILFGDITYNDLQRYSGNILIATPIFCLFMVMGVCALLYYVYLLMKDYRFIQILIQFFTLILFTLGAILLYLSIYLNTYREIANMQKTMPLWIPFSLIIISIIIIIISIFGYFSIQNESKRLTYFYGIICGVFTIVMLFGSIGGIYYANKVTQDLDGQCKGMIEMINQDFLIDYIGCERKYTYNSTSISEMSKCPKQRIIDAWDITLKLEIDKGKEQLNHYGCYDIVCCAQAVDLIRSKSVYLAILACSVFLTFFLCALGSFKIFNDLDEGHEKGTKIKDIWSKSNIVILFLFIVILAILIYAFISLPKRPEVVPDEPTPSPTPTPIPDIIIPSNETEKIINDTKNTDDEFKNKTKIEEEKEGCGDKCPIMRYKVNLSTEDGIFERNKAADFSNIIVSTDKSEDFTGGKRYLVEFSGGSDILLNYTEYFKFKHNCALLPSEVTVSVNGEVFPFTNSTSFIQTNSRMKKVRKANNTSTEIKTLNVPKPIINTISKTDPETNITTTYTEKIEIDPNINQTKITKTSAVFDPKTGRVKRSILTNTTLNSISTIVTQEPGQDSKIETKIDFNKIQVGQKFQILNRKMDYSLVNDEGQMISGVVRKIDYKSKTPLENANIVVSAPDFPECGKFKTTTDKNGQFKIPKINALKSTGSNYEIIAGYQNLKPFVQTITAGGLGFSPIIDMGYIDLLDPTMLQKANMNSTVLNSLTNMELENVKVSLIKGYVQIEQKVINTTSTDGTSFLQTSSNYEVASTNLTDLGGNWKFFDVSPSQYTLLFEKEGFYTESYSN